MDKIQTFLIFKSIHIIFSIVKISPGVIFLILTTKILGKSLMSTLISPQLGYRKTSVSRKAELM